MSSIDIEEFFQLHQPEQLNDILAAPRNLELLPFLQTYLIQSDNEGHPKGIVVVRLGNIQFQFFKHGILRQKGFNALIVGTLRYLKTHRSLDYYGGFRVSGKRV